MERQKLAKGQRALVAFVLIGTVVIALIGFAGSYDSVFRLAQRNGFGWFSYLLPLGVDLGISVYLALDLLLTWMRIPLPILRQVAWLLTAATIVFNAAVAWPKPLASGMHAVVPLLFVAGLEAARHGIGQMAAIDADKLFERTRLARWIVSPIATIRLWRRRVLWELRSYEETLEMERRRVEYRLRLRATYGRFWRRRAPVDQILLLKLANLGRELPEFSADPQPDRLATAAVEAGRAPSLSLLPSGGHPESAALSAPSSAAGQPLTAGQSAGRGMSIAEYHSTPPSREQLAQWIHAAVEEGPIPGLALPPSEVRPKPLGLRASSSAPGQPPISPRAHVPAGSQEAAPAVPTAAAQFSGQRSSGRDRPTPQSPQKVSVNHVPKPASAPDETAVERIRRAFEDYANQHGTLPDGEQLGQWLFDHYDMTGRTGGPLSPGHLRRYLPGLKADWEAGRRLASPTPAPPQ